MAKRLWKMFDGEPYFINPRRKGGKKRMARRTRKPRIRRHSQNIRRRVRRVRRFTPAVFRNFENPVFRFRKRRHVRKHNPNVKAFSKKVAGVSAGALTPIIMSAILPFDFGSKLKNLLRDITYGVLGYGITKVYKPLSGYSNYYLVGAVAGSLVNYSKDRILEIGFIKGLQASRALPEAKPAEAAKTSFYYSGGEDPYNFIKNDLIKKGLPPMLVS